MTRQELYDLVWREPITHAAKRFGISDVALRKTCVRHVIPTPPAGYWAKLAHGKTVRKVPLPPLPKGESDWIRLEPKPHENIPQQVSAALDSVRKEATETAVQIIVPKERPEILHPAAKELAAMLRKTREDETGFLHWNSVSTYYQTYSVSISRALIERATVLLDALFKVLVTRGHTVALESGLKVSVDGEMFELFLRETKVQVPHKPTQDELKRQAEHDANVKRFPTIYKPGRIIWRSWDYVPSGRLSLELKDPSRDRWDNKDLVGRWYDRKTKTLEEYLSDAIPALKEASILAKHRRAEKLERERLKVEREELLRREKARRDREQKRLEYLTKKASAYDAYCRLERLWEVLQPQLASDGKSEANRIIRSLGLRLELDGQQFAASTLEVEVRDLGLFAEEDIGDVL